MIPNMRAWDKVRKEMVYATIEKYDDGFAYRFPHFDDDDPIYMMGTGIPDKNGKEVYEGDVYLSIFRDKPFSANKSEKRIKSVVCWSDEGKFYGKRIDANITHYCSSPDNVLGQDVEVIGTIHDKEEK